MGRTFATVRMPDLFTDVHFKVDTLDSICMQMSC